jgi:hypothetical protein
MYTVEVYKRDRRLKSGERLVEKEDLEVTRSDAQGIQEAYELQGYRVEIFETWVTRENFLSGKRYQERYDTPRSCSPATELYWSM